MSTHTLHVAEEIADTIGIVDRGRLLFHGPLERLHAGQRGASSFERLFLRSTEEGMPVSPQ
jgi:ABC-2 type transport system ATP-binding protein